MKCSQKIKRHTVLWKIICKEGKIYIGLQAERKKSVEKNQLKMRRTKKC